MEKKCYVYLLKESNDVNDVGFYVGKGTGGRAYVHLRESRWSNPKNTHNPFLYHKIKSLMDAGTPPIVYFLAINLTSNEAYEIESQYIKKHGRRFSDGGVLFNVSEKSGGPATGTPRPKWSEETKQNFKKVCKAFRKYDPLYEELYNDFVVLGKTRQQIAVENNCSTALVKKRLQELGISGKKPKSKRYPPKNEWYCKACNKSFTTPQCTKRKYCSRKCYHDSKGKHDKN